MNMAYSKRLRENQGNSISLSLMHICGAFHRSRLFFYTFARTSKVEANVTGSCQDSVTAGVLNVRGGAQQPRPSAVHCHSIAAIILKGERLSPDSPPSSSLFKEFVKCKTPPENTGAAVQPRTPSSQLLWRMSVEQGPSQLGARATSSGTFWCGEAAALLQTPPRWQSFAPYF